MATARRNLCIDICVDEGGTGRRALTQVQKQVQGVSRSATSAQKTTTSMGTALSVIGRHVLPITSVAAGFELVRRTVIGVNADLETARLQFQTLTGSADQAATHVERLFQFAKETPFDTAQIIEASRLLQVMGGDALNTMENLTLMGDAAAATSVPLPEIATNIGRITAAIQVGGGIGEYTRRLTEVGVIAPDVALALNELAKAGGTSEQAMRMLSDAMAETQGAMELQQQTWSGLISTFLDTSGLLISKVGRPFFELGKMMLDLSNQGMDVLITSLDMQGRAFSRVIDVVRGRTGLIPALADLTDMMTQTTNEFEAAQAGMTAFEQRTRDVKNAVSMSTGLGLEVTSAADALAEMDAAMGGEGISASAREAAAAATALAEEQAKANAEFRDSITQYGAWVGWVHDGNAQVATQVSLLPQLGTNVENLRGQLQGLTVDGVIPATGGFLELDGALNSGVNPSVQSSIGLMDSFKGTLQDVWDQAVASTGGILDAFRGMFSGSGGGLSGIVSGGLSTLVDLFSGGMFSLGGLVSRGLGAIGGMFRRLFGGPSAEELAGREIVENFQKNSLAILNETQAIEAGGELWRATNIRVRDSYLEVGLSEQQALTDVQALYDAIKKGPEETQAALDVIIGNMRSVEDAATGAADAMREMFRANAAANRQQEVSSFQGPAPPTIVPMQHGGAGRVTRPTLFLAGEAGPEDFAFSGAGRRFGGGVNVTVNVDGFMDSPQTQKRLAGLIRDVTLRSMQRLAHT